MKHDTPLLFQSEKRNQDRVLLHFCTLCFSYCPVEMLWWQAVSLITIVYSLKYSESVRWPAGTYGLPKPASGCPMADGFQWKEGWRSQDLHSNNAKSSEFHLDGKVDLERVNRSFCIKSTSNKNNRPNWPPGQYCIYKRGTCPNDLTRGFVFWDDDDNLRNGNSKSGILPGGTYNRNTQINFCCKTRGNKASAVLLPSQSPFYLLAYKSAKCQTVMWTVANLEWIHYDTEHSNNNDRAIQSYPYEAGKQHPTIYYCHYRGCEVTLNAVSGTFQSPNNSDTQYCSWKIMVNEVEQIHLMFKYFSEQNENGFDELQVYDGVNATGVMLGVFNGSHPPPKDGICSSSNRIFVIFKSDKNGSYTGIKASYYGFNFSAPSEMTPLPTGAPKTIHTVKETTSIKEPRPTKEGEKRHQSGKSGGKGFNVVAVVVPIVSIFILSILLVTGFFCWRRRRTKKEAHTVLFSARSSDQRPMSVENPYYGRDVIIANTNEMYTEPVTGQGRKNEVQQCKDLVKKDQESLYDSATNGVAWNPVYDSALVIANTDGSCFSQDELYTEPVTEHQKRNVRPHYMGLAKGSQNSLYSTAAADSSLNPVYESSVCRNAKVESPLYMELERETPLQEDNAADAELNPVYDSST